MTLKSIFVRHWNVRLGDRCNYFHRRCAVFFLSRDIGRDDVSIGWDDISASLRITAYIAIRWIICQFLLVFYWTHETISCTVARHHHLFMHYDRSPYMDSKYWPWTLLEQYGWKLNFSTNLRWHIIFCHFTWFNRRYMQKFWNSCCESFPVAEITFQGHLRTPKMARLKTIQLPTNVL